MIPETSRANLLIVLRSATLEITYFLFFVCVLRAVYV